MSSTSQIAHERHRCVGAKVDEHRGALILNYPIQHGVVQNWADMEKIWSYVYSKENLNVPSEEHAVRTYIAMTVVFETLVILSQFYVFRYYSLKPH